MSAIVQHLILPKSLATTLSPTNIANARSKFFTMFWNPFILTSTELSAASSVAVLSSSYTVWNGLVYQFFNTEPQKRIQIAQSHHLPTSNGSNCSSSSSSSRVSLWMSMYLSNTLQSQAIRQFAVWKISSPLVVRSFHRLFFHAPEAKPFAKRGIGLLSQQDCGLEVGEQTRVRVQMPCHP